MIAAAAAGCGNKTAATPEGGKDEAADTAGRGADALWALAPAGAAAGVVFAPGSIDAAYRVLSEVERVAAARPSSQRLYGALRAALAATPANKLLDRERFVRMGVDLSRGFALFFDERMQVVGGTLPFRDLAAMAGVANKPVVKRGDRDVIERSDGGVCAMAGGRVMCARDLAAIDAMAAGDGGALAARVRALPAHRRGDVEFMADIARIDTLRTGFAKRLALRDPGLLAVAVRIGGGVLAANVAAEGVLPLPLRDPAAVPAAVRPRPERAVGLVAVHLDWPALLGALPPLPPEIPIPGGRDLRRDVIEQIAGDMTLSTPLGARPQAGAGGPAGVGEAAIAVRDGDAVRAALPGLCALAEREIPSATAATDEGVCRLTFPASDATVGQPLVVRASVADGALRIAAGLGGPGDAPAADGPAPSAHTAPLVRDAHVVVWGRSFDPFAAAPAEAKAAASAVLARIAGVTPEQLDGARWALAHIAEAGVGLTARGGGYDLSVVVVSHAADPDDVYRAYEAAVARDLDGDHDGYLAAMRELAARAGTLAGRQAAIVARGAPPAGGTTAIAAAIAIPAFIKYARRAKTSEARVLLSQLYRAAEAARAAGKRLASVGPTPPLGTCCRAGGARCAPRADLWDHPTWRALQFEVADPHYYHYQYVADGDGFVVRALGDLDCDGTYSTFEIRPGAEGPVTSATDELE